MPPPLEMPLWLDRPAGDRVPLYILRFDAAGLCLSPQTQQAVLDALAAPGGPTHVFLFSHGWNTTWPRAHDHYTGFFREYLEFVTARGLALPGAVRPLLVGIFWPSIVLTSADDEPPAIAGVGDPDRPDVQAFLDELALTLPPEDVRRLGELTRKPAPFTEGDALEAARLLLPLYAGLDDEAFGPDPRAPAPADVVASWRRVAAAEAGSAPPPGGQGGFADDAPPSGPAAAGFLDAFNPRDLLRYATVYQMKDRAGLIGRTGVARLLRWMLSAAPAASFHLVGHSYGCKVLLAALCGDPLPADTRVESLLLVQPAVNFRCFAVEARPGRPGAYRDAFARVRQPVLTTHTAHDGPLADIFHLFVRRGGDLGELGAAAVEMTCGGKGAPSVYAALGGYGPGGCAPGECVGFDMTDDRPHDLPPDARIAALNGDNALTGHGDIRNRFVFWALNQQLARAPR